MHKKKLGLLIALLAIILPSCTSVPDDLNSDSSKTTTSDIIEEQVKVEEIKLSADKDYKVDDKYQIFVDEYLDLELEVLPLEADNKAVEWQISNPCISLDENNLVARGVSVGTSIITAKSTDGSDISGSITIEVLQDTRVFVETVTLDGKALINRDIIVGDIVNLSATVAPENATNQELNWTSSNESVLTVNASGKVTAVKAGTATINVTSTDGTNKSDNISFTITPLPKPIESVSINASKTNLAIGEKITLTASILPVDTTDSKVVTWSSSNTSVMTINASSGEVEAKAIGNTVITVTTTVGGKTGNITLNVIPKAIESVSITASKTALTVGEKLTITATVLPADTTESKEVTWSSSNNSIVSINQNTGALEAIAVGSATITVTTVVGNKTATKNFSVTAAPTGLTSIDLVLPTSGAPTGWTYSGTDKYAASVKMDTTGDYILTPLISMGDTIKITLNLAVNGGTTTTTNGNIQFGLEGLDTTKATIINYHYLLHTSSVPAAYGNVDFYLTGIGISYLKIIYKTKLSGVNIGVKSIKAANYAGEVPNPDPDPDPDPTPGEGYYKVNSFSKYLQDLEYVEGHLPSSGSAKMLVVPVDFKDLKETNTSKIDEIKKAFYGTDTEWESVKTFYQKSSYGKTNIDVTVLDTWQTAANNISYYNVSNENTQLTRLEEMFRTILNSLNSTINFADYDGNKDGYIDSIHFVYNHDPDYVNDNLWWAWQYYFMNDLTLDKVMPNTYVWSSYGFMKEDGYNNEKYQYNAHTYIHETGHVFGIEDYYDYDSSVGPSNGLGGADMMDYTIGDHNPFTKMLLGWAHPTVINTTSSVTLDLAPFQNDGDFIIVANNFNATKGMFDEYFILEYYTPTGLHAKDKMFTVSGIRVFHVSANLKTYTYSGGSYEYFTYDNTETTYKLISIVEADGGNNSKTIGNSDLYTVSKTISNLKYNNNTALSYTIKVNSLTTDKASLTITKV